MDQGEPGVVLVTERLRLRPLEAKDAMSLFILKSDPAVTWCYGQRPHESIDRTMEWIARNIDDQRCGEVLYWVLEKKEGGGAVGACCLWNFNDGRTTAELGYELRPELWRQGLMTEALTAVLGHAFGVLDLHRVEANPLATNRASISLLLKLGFRIEGTLRERQLLDGSFADQLCLGLLRGDRLPR